MTEMWESFDSFEEVRAFKDALLKDKNNSCFQQVYDHYNMKYVLTWNHRDVCKDQKKLEEF